MELWFVREAAVPLGTPGSLPRCRYKDNSLVKKKKIQKCEFRDPFPTIGKYSLCLIQYCDIFHTSLGDLDLYQVLDSTYFFS